MQFSKSKRKRIFEKTNGRCAYCGCLLNEKTSHIDHCTPRASGGTNNFDNLMPSCPDCNLFKSNSDIEELRERIEYLPLEDIHGRILSAYYDIIPQSVTFYFEKLEAENERHTVDSDSH